tara:strand:- start:190 stop:426 length:237 start_codon:yes stop_codon:yes gene_type:complete
MKKVLRFFLIGKILITSLLANYSIGDQIAVSDQEMLMNICSGHEPNNNTDSQMSLSDYNGELNGGQYYVIYIDMSASW